MTLTHKIAKHTTIQVVGRIFSYVFSLTSIIFITRYLGTGGFGQYTTITVFVAALAIFAEFGIDQIMIKEYFRFKNKGRILANALGLRIVTAFSVFLVGCLVAYLFPYSEVIKNGIWIVAFASFIGCVEIIFVDVFQIYLQMHHQVIAELVGRAIGLVLTILSVYFDLGLTYILLSIVAGNVFVFLIAYIWANNLIKIKIKIDLKFWKKLLIKAIPIGIASVLIFIYYRVDTIILSVLKPSTDVGIYGASYKVIDIVNAFPGMFCGLVFPILAGYFAKQNMKRFNDILQKSFNVLVITGVPVAAILFGLARPIILLIAGNQFAQSIIVLRILAPATLMIFANWIFWMALIGGDRQKSALIPYGFLSAFNIGLNLILIPQYSYIGAAIATVITQILALIIPWIMTYKFFGTKLSFLTTLKALISAIVMTIFFYLVQKYNLGVRWSELENINTFIRLISLGITVILGAGVYLGVLYLLRGINKQIITKVVST